MLIIECVCLFVNHCVMLYVVRVLACFNMCLCVLLRVMVWCRMMFVCVCDCVLCVV